MTNKLNDQVYYCKECSYTTTRKSSWSKHLKTQKHYNAVNKTHSINNSKYKCIGCHKIYKYRSGLLKHIEKTGCGGTILSCDDTMEDIVNIDGEMSNNVVSKSYEDLEGEVKELKGVIKTFFDTQTRVMDQLEEQNKIISEMVPKIGNNNNSFNINVFLNEKCKDALNMSDFIESLQIQVADLLYTKDNGLLEGISSVMINGLKQLDTHKRPIHCTDIKRETLYIKDNDEWDKENGKVKLKAALNDIAYKERKAIKEWESANPGWNNTDKGKQEYINLVQAIMSDVNEPTPKENRVIRNIAKEINIDKDIIHKIKN